MVAARAKTQDAALFLPCRRADTQHLRQPQPLRLSSIKDRLDDVRGQACEREQAADESNRDPSRVRVEGADVDLGHTAIDVPGASERPGDGQKQVVRVLRENNKLRLPEDDPDSPTYIRDRTPLKKGQITTAALRDEFRRDPGLPMLVGDDVFMKGIRQGIEQGDYVYRSGDLLWGKGDPWANIKIDEQSFVYTASYARESGIWPRPATTATPEPSGPSAVATPTGRPLRGDPGATGPGLTPRPGESPILPLGDNAIAEEGVLKEALTKLWEKARSRKFERIGTLTLKLYDPTDGFRLLGLVGAIPKSGNIVRMEGGYETTEGGALEIRFTGQVPDAQPVKDFLDPQLRAAKEKSLDVTFTVTFPDGLLLAGDEPEKLTERLSRFGTGAAYVAATAEGAR